MTKRTLWMYVGAVLAIALFTFGCGGDDGVDQSVHDMVAAERDAAQAATAAAEAAAAAAAAEAAATLAAAQMAADTAATEAAAALATAQAALMAAETAEAAAVAARNEARTGEMEAETRASMAEAAATQAAMDAQEAAMTAQMAADALQEALDDLEEARMAQMMAEGDRDDAQMMVDAAMQADMNARGRHITAAIEFLYSNATGDPDAEANTMYQSPTLDTSAVAAKTAASPNIAEAPTVVEVSLSVDGELSVELDNAAPLEFEEYNMADYGPPAIDGWTGAKFSRRNNADNAEQILYVYSDVVEDKPETFSKRHGASVQINTAKLGLAESRSFPTRVGDPSESFRGDQRVGVAGSYDGVPGMFTCSTSGAATGADCVIGVGANGMRTITLLEGTTFTFVPTDNQATVTVSGIAYLTFGFWLDKPDDPDSAHSFVSIMGSTIPAHIHSNGAIGRAKYEGPAAGKYVERNPDDGNSTVGIFTATAQLLADFEAGAVPEEGAARADRMAANPGTILGTVSDFMANGESLGNWRVTLGEVDLLDSDTTTTGMFAGGTTARIGATVDATGQWQGQLHGRRDDGDPVAVVGRFDVSNDVVTVGGSFGARHTGE